MAQDKMAQMIQSKLGEKTKKPEQYIEWCDCNVLYVEEAILLDQRWQHFFNDSVKTEIKTPAKNETCQKGSTILV